VSIGNLAWQNTLSNRGRFGFTFSAVVLSVAFLTATLILADSLTGTAESDIAEAYAEVSFVVEGPIVLQSDGGGPGEALQRLTKTLPAETVETVATVDGVQAVAGETVGFARLVSAGQAVGTGTAADVGRTWIDEPTLNPFALLAGDPPTDPDHIVVDEALAEAGGLAVGDTAEVLTATGIHGMTISGVATFGGGASAPLQRTVLFASDTAPILLDDVGYQLLRVATDPAVDAASVQADVADALETSGVEAGVVDVADYIANEQNAVTAPFEFLSLFLLAFAAIATITGVTIIVNTFTLAVAQRQRELALFRAVGATRRQVLGTVLGEAALIAIASTLVGIGLGVASASGLRRLMDLGGLSFLDGPLSVSLTTLAISAAVGIVVTIGSAWVPARRAARVAPVEALRASTTESAAVSRARALLGVLLTVVGATALVLAAWQADALLLLGATALVPGLILAGPSLVTAAAQLMRAPLSRLRGVEGSMAVTNLSRNPRRSAATSLALTLGVATIGLFAVTAASLSGSVSRSIEESLQADVVVRSVSTEFATIDPGLADRIDQIDGVTAVAAVATTEAALADGSAATVAGIGSDAGDLFDFATTGGSLDDLQQGGVAVWTGDLAENEEAPVLGEELTFTFAATTVELEVVALFDQTLAGFDAPTHLVADTTLAEAVTGLPDNLLFVDVAGGSDGSAVDAVKNAVAATPGSLFETRDGYLASTGSEIDAVLNLTYALLSLTVVIGILGVANTTALSISERVRELGLLRAVGVTQRGVRRVIGVEVVVLSLLGSVVGTVIAVVGGWALVRALGGDALTAVVIPWFTIALTALGAAVAGITLGALPARSASRRPVLDAVAGR
jgi:putative ABC transport system permease protein